MRLVFRDVGRGATLRGDTPNPCVLHFEEALITVHSAGEFKEHFRVRPDAKLAAARF
jgi:hypothetical protein